MAKVIGSGSAVVARRIRQALDGAGFEDGSSNYQVLTVTEPLPDALAALTRALHDRRRTVVVCCDPDGPAAHCWEFLQAGAADVLTWTGDGTVGHLLDRMRRWRAVDEVVDGPVVRGLFLGRSPALTAALRDLVELAVFGCGPILLTGETGTGKELAAKVVHALTRPGERAPFVVLDCTTIVPSLSGSELFGHEKGAFTGADRPRTGAFAAAHSGVLFLDEIGELPVSLQQELLRVVQERTYKRVGGDAWSGTDFRLVSATNRDLPREARRGRFRNDLYHRLAAGVVRLPALRERPEDLQELFTHFLTQAIGGPPPSLDPAVVTLLAARDYPGNVRELRQFAVRVAARHVRGWPITPGDIPQPDRPRLSAPGTSDDAPRDPGARDHTTSAAATTATATATTAEPLGCLETAVRNCLRVGTPLSQIKATVADLAVTVALHEAGGHIPTAARRLGITDRAVQLRVRRARQATTGSGDQPMSPDEITHDQQRAGGPTNPSAGTDRPGSEGAGEPGHVMTLRDLGQRSSAGIPPCGARSA